MWLLSPLSWLLIVLLLAVPAWRMRTRNRWLWLGCLAFATVAVAATTPLVGNGLLAWLERPVPADADCTVPPSTVVVVAGGLDRPPRDAGDFGVLSSASQRRLEAGVQYWREHAGRRLVLTGGQTMQGAASEGELMAAYAQWLGVPSSEVRVDSSARNTWQNARFVARMKPGTSQPVVLVTSALHMRRALFAFHSAGFRVCPLPTDYRSLPFELPGTLVPRSSALEKTELALHELVGLVYYRWLSWSD